ncbi:HEAT repeat domain-containing protein [Thalassoroseus pseudoceratinae]|uniref:HEAT repeat domain-containing protein n=1 Tax=Thalassoroseus pseudoceratinae TaxID=2713176 RepID=UPI001421D2EE|nr:HEAT repeat domain-containing protein [Thalassoroseus pseudoceratinae]
MGTRYNGEDIKRGDRPRHSPRLFRKIVLEKVDVSKLLLTGLAFLCGCFTFADRYAVAQSPFGNSPSSQRPSAEGTTSEASAEKKQKSKLELTLESFRQMDDELVRLKLKPQPTPTDKPGIYIVPDVPYVGYHYTSKNGKSVRTRYVAFELLIANTTEKELKLVRDEIEFSADTQFYPLTDLEGFPSYGYSIGNEYRSLQKMLMPETLKIPPGEVAAAGMVFHGMPFGGGIPTMHLTLKLNGQQRTLDINRLFRGKLRLETARMGPYECLGILTIHGDLNGISLGTVVEELDRLTEDKVARVVLEWKDDTPSLESNLVNWLNYSLGQVGQTNSSRHNSYPQFPSLPTSLRVVHVANLPKRNRGSISSTVNPLYHETKADAVVAALQSAYAKLPTEELLDSLRSNDPILQAAALRGGGDRLPESELPILLKLSESKMEPLQESAIAALASHGHERAIQKLRSIVADSKNAHRVIAIEALATSRFASAQVVLKSLLENGDEETQRAIVDVLAKYPAPIWGEAIYKFAQEFNTDVGRSALRALTRLGHPKLEGLLRKALDEGDEKTQPIALELLASSHSDANSEQIALEFLLKQLEEFKLNSRMTQILSRTKDRRAIPLLLKYIDKHETNRQSAIQLLGQIGDREVARQIADRFEKFNVNEKQSALTSLQRLQSDRLLDCAEIVLKDSKAGNLHRTLCDILRREGSHRAVKLLAEALEQDTIEQLWEPASQALWQHGSRTARVALEQASHSKKEKKRTAATRALKYLRDRSPAYRYVRQAQHYVTQKKYEEAVAQYGIALAIDEDLVAAYTGRGNVRLTQKKYKQAFANFEKAVELDPTDSDAVIGQAVAMIHLGQVDDSLKFLELAEKKNKVGEDRKEVHLYNTACVYSLAVEKWLADAKDSQEPTDDRKIELHRNRALATLKSAVEKGFRDAQQIQDDADLKAIRDTQEFDAILKSINNPPQS